MAMNGSNTQVKDTGVKDKTKSLKYESMKGKHSISDIYVVYKNKRAYPAYLIKYKGWYYNHDLLSIDYEVF